MKFISYGTKNTPYEGVIKDYLIKSLNKLDLPYYVEYPNDFGDWQKNTHYKAEFVKKCLLELKESVIFVDSDATVLRDPVLFDEIEKGDNDIALHYLDWCYDKETEILTENGWKLFKNLNKNEKVATQNIKTKQLEFQLPIKHIQYHYKGLMHKFKSTQVDLRVTPNHNMLVIEDKGRNTKLNNYNDYKIVSAVDLETNNRFYIPKTVKWNGTYKSHFILNRYNNSYGNNKNLKYNKNAKKIPIKYWIKFIAWYLSEGSCTKNSVSIGQKANTKHYNDLKNIMQKIAKYVKSDLKIYKYKGKVDSFQIHNTQLAKYLMSFSKAKDKFIPDYIKQSTSSLIQLFLSTYIKGDGTTSISSKFNKTRQIFTASVKMKNDLEELIMKIGWSSTICSRISGFGHLVYVIHLKTTKYSTIRKQHKSKIMYDDMVYCVETKNGIVMVRTKSGNQVWCGNCKNWRNQDGGDKFEALSGTMYFRYNQKVLDFLDIWIKKNEENAQWEQRNMQEILEENIVNLDIEKLPYSYCTVVTHGNSIPKHMINPGEVIILHWQKSRKFKNKRLWNTT